MIKAKGLEEVFELDPIGDEEEECKELEIIPKIDSSPAVVENSLPDSNFIRKILKDLVTKSTKALDNAIEAQEEETIPRNSEAVAKIIEGVDKVVNSLLQLNKAEKESAPKQSTNPTINNSQVVIATSDEILSRIIEGTKENSSNDKSI